MLKPARPDVEARRDYFTSNDINASESNLLDMTTTVSIVLHHFTAWAGFVERTVAENQKFVKDAKPNARRRLCRVVGQSDNNENANDDVDDVMESMESMTMWNENCGDY